MTGYEDEQAAVVACLLDHFRQVGADDESALLRVTERAGFKNRAALSGLRRLVDDGRVWRLGDRYTLLADAPFANDQDDNRDQ